MPSTPAAGSLRTDVHAIETSAGAVELTVRDHDRTRPFLLLHGGGGVASMAGFAGLLAERTRSRVLLPTHPGFGGTPKAAGLTGVVRAVPRSPSRATTASTMTATAYSSAVWRSPPPWTTRNPAITVGSPKPT